MLTCVTAADGPEALVVRGATAIPGARLPRGAVLYVARFEVASTFILAVWEVGYHTFVIDITLGYHDEITMISHCMTGGRREKSR